MEMRSVVQFTVSGDNPSIIQRLPIVYKAQLTRARTTNPPPSTGSAPPSVVALPPDTRATPINDTAHPTQTRLNGISRSIKEDRKAVMAGLAPMITPAAPAPMC